MMRQHVRENILPIVVMFAFFLATLFSARQLINHTSMVHEQHFHNRVSAQEMARAFNDFEALFLSYLVDESPRSRAELNNGIHYLKKMYDRLYYTMKSGDIDGQLMVNADGIETDLVVLETLFKPGSRIPREGADQAAIAALYQMHISLSDLGYDLILENNQDMHSGEIYNHRLALYISVFMMAASGIALIVLLVFKIDRLEHAGEDKEKTLKMLEDRMAAIELAGDGIGIAEEDGRLSFVNRAFAEAYGFSSWHGMIGRRWIEFCDTETRKIMESEVLSALTAGGCWNGIGIGMRKDGDVFKKSISVSALPGQRWILVVRDVSNMLRTEALADQRLAAIEAAGDGIGLVDPDGRLVYMNDALKRLHELDEYEAQDQIGRPWSELYTDLGQEQIRTVVLPSLNETGYWKGESPIMTKAGHIVYAEMSLTLLPDGGLIGTARNITDRLESERERVELEKKFYQAQKMEAVGRLAGGIAHDFNNILAAMMGYAEFLMEDLPEGGQGQEYAKSIHKGGAQARDVVDRLLMFSRTHDHKKESLDLRRRVVDTVSILRSSIPSTILIKLDVGDEPMMIFGNQTLISQAIMNLCVNARDAIGDRHGALTIKISCENYKGFGSEYHVQGGLEKGHAYYALHIIDTGCGMDPQTIEHIFDPFFTTKPVDQGTGLGLSAVHGVMASHNGAVAVRSEPDRGTEFILLFPVIDSQDLATPFGDAVYHPLMDVGPLNILVVDDQPDVRVMMENMLRRMGHRPEVCVDAASALEILKENPDYFNLVITDQTMPGMTGCELADWIAENKGKLPVILISGFSVENLATLVRSRPVIVATIRKPVDRNELARAISRAVMTRKNAA